MLLSRAKIENFRGFKRISVAFESTTVLIGENNYGKTSLLDVLRICLGIDSDHASFPFSAVDFRLAGDETDEAPDPIKVTLTFRERGKRSANPWSKTKLRGVLTRGPRNTRQVVLRVMATLEPASGAIDVEWQFVDRSGEPLGRPNDVRRLDELRRLNPFLLLAPDLGSLASRNDEEENDAPPPARSMKEAARRRLERRVERAYRELATSRAPLSSAVLRGGVEAVERLLERAAKRFAPQIENPRRLLDEVVQTPVPLARGTRTRTPTHGAGMYSIGKLLVFGALLEARGETVISPDARPIYGIEEPEAHLHPQMLAAVWALIEEFPFQKIVTTNSSELLAAVPLRAVRRMMRRRGSIEVFRPGNKLSVDEMRRIGYHIRVRRGSAMFARCWLLIEGETEFWLLPELARLLGYEFPSEGVRCVEFAQVGVAPLIKTANDMGIEWHVLADGDKAGRYYADGAREHLRRDRERDRITLLEQEDIEHCLWQHGYASVYYRLSGVEQKSTPSRRRRERPPAVIEQAMHRHSKPGVALAVVQAAGAPGAPGVPPVLVSVIETVVRLARTCVR
ncbi:MAG: DUF2813 domain-containing protein [bacterium]|nr:DUF2813 domain-containing protein [bacterium]